MHPHRTALQCCEGPAEAVSASGPPLCSSPASSSRSGGSRAFRAIYITPPRVKTASPCMYCSMRSWSRYPRLKFAIPMGYRFVPTRPGTPAGWSDSGALSCARIPRPARGEGPRFRRDPHHAHDLHWPTSHSQRLCMPASVGAQRMLKLLRTCAASMMLVSLSSVYCSAAPISTMPLTISFTSFLALIPWSPISNRTHARSCSTCTE